MFSPYEFSFAVFKGGAFKRQTNQRQSFALCKLCQAKVRVETTRRKKAGEEEERGKGRAGKWPKKLCLELRYVSTSTQLERERERMREKERDNNNRSEIEWTTNGAANSVRGYSQIIRDTDRADTLPCQGTLPCQNKTKTQCKHMTKPFSQLPGQRNMQPLLAICKLEIQRERSGEKVTPTCSHLVTRISTRR